MGTITSLLKKPLLEIKEVRLVPWHLDKQVSVLAGFSVAVIINNLGEIIIVHCQGKPTQEPRGRTKAETTEQYCFLIFSLFLA